MATKLPKLYKLDSIGNIREWSIEWVEGCYVVTHGMKGGQLQSTATAVVEGKNVGKVNETSIAEQTKLEAESLWRKQRDRKGYSESTPTAKPFRPMLAKSYDKDGKHIKFPCYGQCKLDGQRCLAVHEGDKVVLLSRQGKVISSLEHIEEQVYNIAEEGMVLDGELYKHGKSFQEIISATKRDEAKDESADIDYHVYDLVDENSPYIERYKILEQIITEDLQNIKLVESFVIKSVANVAECHSKLVSEGYEGMMLRNFEGEYEINRRSKNLQKVKAFDDAEFEIVGCKTGKGKFERMAILRCKTESGNEFDCTPTGSEEERRQYWIDFQAGKLMGKLLTVKYFGLSTDGIPRFPIGLRIRDYE